MTRARKIVARLHRRKIARAKCTAPRLLGLAAVVIWLAVPSAPRPTIPLKQAPPLSQEYKDHVTASLPPEFWYVPRPTIGQTVTDLSRDNWASQTEAPQKKRDKKH